MKSISIILLAGTAGLGFAAPSFRVVSAPAGGQAVAPESLAAAYGDSLASRTEWAQSRPLPTSLGGIALQVVDSNGTARPAPLLYVSPGQVNFEVPADTAPGMATFHIVNGTGVSPSATAQVQTVAPALFSADGSGKGVAAATAVRIVIPTRIPSPVPVFQCPQPDGCMAVPIDVGIDAPVFLSLYGTGIRNRGDLSGVTATLNGVDLTVLYAGPQGIFDGLDQVNVALPISLHGSGEGDLVLAVDGQTANPVRIAIQ